MTKPHTEYCLIWISIKCGMIGWQNKNNRKKETYMYEEKLSRADKNIINEYVIADRKRTKAGTDFTIIPTYCDDLPEKVSMTDAEMEKFDRTLFWVGALVTLTKKGKIRPVRYNLRKCDIMLVTGAYDITETVKELTLMGKKFGSIAMHLSKEFTQLWEQKFFDTRRGDTVLVRPQQDNSNNEYKILRNFTTEKMITTFFEGQRQR